MGRPKTRYCPRGHDKDAVGRYHRSCVLCLKETSEKANAARSAARVPKVRTKRDTCKNGHRYADVGKDSGGCAACRKARYEARKSSGSVRAGARRAHLLRTYGITEEIYDSIACLQNGQCAICGLTPEKTKANKTPLYVDHDHETKMVRGLLCQACNSGVGMFRDSPHRLRQAALYLEENYCEGRWPPPEDT